MPELDLAAIMNLIRSINQQGIRISRSGNDLKVFFDKGRQVDGRILESLRANKSRILECLASEEVTEVLLPAATDVQSGGVEYDGRKYYEVTQTQNYWLNQEADADYKRVQRTHGVVLMMFRVKGVFYPAAFAQAVAWIVRRHESLRSLFHKIEGRYMMTVGEPSLPDYEMRYVDVRDQAVDERLLNQMALQEEIPQLLDGGALFHTLVIRADQQDHIISIKVHHILTDAWSNEVLVRDLLIAYDACCREKRPELPMLTHQLPDLLIRFSRYTELYREPHRRYWRERYTNLPPVLNIPGAFPREDRALERRIRGWHFVRYPDELRQVLYRLAREYNTTLFVLLQASFKAFLYYKTGEPDMTIGTYALGRDYPETYDQIGSYSRTALIRSVFTDTDNFATAIHRVIASNREMEEYRAFTLIESMGELLPVGRKHDPCWYINLQFVDRNLSQLAEDDRIRQLAQGLEIEVLPYEEQVGSLMPIDMMLDFRNNKECLEIDVQYDISLYDEPMIARMLEEYLDYSTLVATDPSLLLLSPSICDTL